MRNIKKNEREQIRDKEKIYLLKLFFFIETRILKIIIVKATNLLTTSEYILFISVELAMIMDRLYGGVCYAGIDTDPELKYPKGAGRVAFSNQQSYIAAISARFVQLQHGDIDKRVRIFFSLLIQSL